MSFLDKTLWTSVDENNEKLFHNGILFIREKNIETVSIDCKICNKLLVTKEDIESYKNFDACEECYLTYYYTNKEKWNNGWRPNLSNSDIIINNNEVNKDD